MYNLYTNFGLFITTFHLYTSIYDRRSHLHYSSLFICYVQRFCYSRGSHRGDDIESAPLECYAVSWRKSSRCCDRRILEMEHAEVANNSEDSNRRIVCGTVILAEAAFLVEQQSLSG